MSSSSRLPYLTGTAGALLIAFSAIFVRVADVAPSTAAVFRCAYALPALGLVAFLERRGGGVRPWRVRRWSLAAGLFFAADLTFWHYSIEFVGAGLATVLGNVQVVVVPLAAWLLLDERPDQRLLVAVPVVLGGVVLISGVLGAGAYGEDPLLGAVYGLLTALAYSGFLLCLRAGSDGRPGAPLFDATLVAAVAAALAGVVAGTVDLAPTWPAHGWLLALALTSQVVAWLLISLSLPRLPAAVTSVLLTLQPVGSVLLGIALLGEAPSVVQLAGVLVVLTGILLATLRVRRPATAPAAERAPEPIAA
jgi:drug/metabolite transporter (DMT)-like permease